MTSKQRTNERMLVSLSPYLKEKVVKHAEKYGCTQTEVVRKALIKMLEGKA